MTAIAVHLRDKIRVAIGIVLFLQVLYGLIPSLSEEQLFRPLVKKDGWTLVGSLFPFSPPPETIEVPPRMSASPEFQMWRSWSPETSTTLGTLSTADFNLPAYLAVPYQGFPGEVPESRMFLQVESGAAQIEIANLRTNTQWATVFLKIPARYVGQSAKLVAVAADSKTYVAVGTPFEVSSSVYFANTAFAPRAVAVFCTWLLLVIFMMSGGYVAARLSPKAELFAAGFVAIGAFGIFTFCAVNLSLKWAAVTVPMSVGAACCLLMCAWMFDRGRFNHVLGCIRVPVILWLGIAIAFSAFVSAADSGGGSWAINGLFSPLRWSSDNQLPFLFAEKLYDGSPREAIVWGPWLAADRTPLLADILLMLRFVVIAPIAGLLGQAFIPTAYMMMGITILSSWVPVLIWLCRTLRKPNLPVLFLVFVSAPMILINTVYTWPKIFGASYVLLAFGLLFTSRQSRSSMGANLYIVALAAAMAFLSHASNVFALVPLGLFFLRLILGERPMTVAIAVACVAIAVVPWLIWQRVFQPNSNELMRYAFSGDYDVRNRGQSVWTSMTLAYSRLGLSGWLADKYSNLKMMSGFVNWTFFGETSRHAPALDRIGVQRVLDFFVPARSVGVAVLGLFAMPFLSIANRSDVEGDVRMIKLAAAIGLSGIVLTFLITLPPAITPAEPYGSLLLMIFAGAAAIARLPVPVARLIAGFAVSYFAVVWVVHPLVFALRIHWMALAVVLESIACMAVILMYGDSPVQHRSPTVAK